MITPYALNRITREAFISVLGGVFEHSPWVAARVWERGPFESAVHLHHEMVDVVNQAAVWEQLALLTAHPELGSRLIMSDSSQEEQKSAGLGNLSTELCEELVELNDLYKKKFDFPFILAVRGHTSDSIADALKRRLANNPELEFRLALDETAKIADFRLREIIAESSHTVT
ncbi:2-oxo-4-hydroxy-4-carboxy-5-ureidoimidazoline decarboxylase [Gorillibacterium massiliense]|uniref:2-oxo-4-hydroxy-4-carboxy-5-ureidoimidazoline decarboxylase n=1 Tax=Gorillibacterium massiliense TaxID=1280390 RepID=UPI0004B17D67|nr:2-oxo-4-hydroxy-4-carboxy-5-ureidoimidazoline decarboxylase [Gorillibacterium massiliense]